MDIEWEVDTKNTCAVECNDMPHNIHTNTHFHRITAAGGYNSCPQSCGPDGYCAGPIDAFNYPKAIRPYHLIVPYHSSTGSLTTARCIKPGKMTHVIGK